VRLQDSLLLDDARVARARVESGRAAGRSKRALQQRLRRHGVDADTAAAALAAVDDDRATDAGSAEEQAALVWARKKGLLAKDRTKALAALARQGFSFAVAKQALATLVTTALLAALAAFGVTAAPAVAADPATETYFTLLEDASSMSSVPARPTSRSSATRASRKCSAARSGSATPAASPIAEATSDNSACCRAYRCLPTHLRLKNGWR
jgi:hypothetical protein